MDPATAATITGKVVLEGEAPAPEIMVPFECDVHGRMNAYVGVVGNPYYAVTVGEEEAREISFAFAVPK